MSIQQVPERSFMKSYHNRRDSDELDVFEAAQYFSGANEVSSYQKTLRSGGRISLDITMMSSTTSSTIQAQTHQYNVDVMVEKPTTKEKKYKQPNSPGGRLASFLNSLFSQNSSKKKKSKSLSAQPMKDEDDESPDGRRKRRSSISHFRSFNNSSSRSADNSKSSFYSSSSSEFTSFPCTQNNYKDFKSALDHPKPAVLPNVSKNNCHVKSTASQKVDTRKVSTNHDNGSLDDAEFKFITTTTTNTNIGFPSDKRNIFGHEKNRASERDYTNFINEMDDGADSDSSSDLFELQNYDLGCCYSSGLPVYETTHMNTIKRGAPITS